jgi:hypothetical protein
MTPNFEMNKKMNTGFDVGDRILVKGGVLSLSPSKYPAPPNSVAIDSRVVIHTFEGIVHKIKGDGEIHLFRVTKIINPVSDTFADSSRSIKNKLALINEIEDCEVELLPS